MCSRASLLWLAQQMRSAWGLPPAGGLALGFSPNSAATRHAEVSRSARGKGRTTGKEGKFKHMLKCHPELGTEPDPVHLTVLHRLQPSRSE